MPILNNDNTERALMLAREAPIIWFHLISPGFHHLILMPLNCGLPFKTSNVNIWRWLPLFGSLALLLLTCPGCSMQKRTTRSGWHVESAVWKQKRSPQTELPADGKGALRLPHNLPAASNLPLYTFKRELQSAPKGAICETSPLPSTPVEFRPWIVDTLLSDTGTNTPQDSVLSQELKPSAHSNADISSDTDDLNSMTIVALIAFMLGVSMLPAPLGALLIALGVIVFLVGRIVKLANKKKSKGRGARIFGNVLLILLAGAYGVFATIVLFLEELFG